MRWRKKTDRSRKRMTRDSSGHFLRYVSSQPSTLSLCRSAVDAARTYMFRSTGFPAQDLAPAALYRCRDMSEWVSDGSGSDELRRCRSCVSNFPWLSRHLLTLSGIENSRSRNGVLLL